MKTFKDEEVMGMILKGYQRMEELEKENAQLKNMRDKLSQALIDYRSNNDPDALADKVQSAVCGERVFIYRMPWKRDARVPR